MKKKRGNKSSQLTDGKDFILEGRHPCSCEASKHDLFSNCLNCGRVICEQEGIGECFTCGIYVLSKEERLKLFSDSAEAKARVQQLINDGAKLDFVINDKKNSSLKDIAASITTVQPGLEQAIQHKEKLLDFDKHSVARSKVFDDQVDYFSLRTQNFVSDENRKAIASKVDYLVGNKFNKQDKIMIDFGTMTISDCSESVIKDVKEEHRKLEELSAIKTDYKMVPSATFIDEKNSNKSNIPTPIYIPSDCDSSSNQEALTNNNNKNLPKIFSMNNYSCKVQDKDLETIEDRGMCLAMHQPYASLLVAGIKRFEGRTWYSTFKGRLWIYAAQRKATTEEISKVETFYNQLGYTKFPNQYPTGAIVGCVTVEDCLPNETYREQYPECEIDSPYAFICNYPIVLSKPLPIMKGGGNRIYKLEPNTHKACKMMLGF
ncbi:Activating signal cointegrator 1 [Blomia tropicalis]|nr:Activating signal cointegrator 1 [Blomia tropicalis]